MADLVLNGTGVQFIEITFDGNGFISTKTGVEICELIRIGANVCAYHDTGEGLIIGQLTGVDFFENLVNFYSYSQFGPVSMCVFADGSASVDKLE